jgi:Putative metallopeptidase
MSPKTNPTGQWRRIFVGHRMLLIALLIFGLSMTCLMASGSGQVSSRSKAKAAASLLPSSLQAKVEGKGVFKLVYVPVKDKKFAHIEKVVKDSKLFETLIDISNKELILPVDLTVVFRECNGTDENGEKEDPTNAWYSSKDHSLTMCYGLVQQSEDLFKDDEKSEEELEDAVLNSTAWTFYHELGHALIDIYKIAHTGKEEDAADELSTFILITEGGDAGEKAALDGAENFYREASDDNDLNEEQFADVHSLDKQRFYNIICLVYGSNTKKYEYLTEGKDPILPEGRAEDCEHEYERVTRAWTNILGPHLKPNK